MYVAYTCLLFYGTFVTIFLVITVAILETKRKFITCNTSYFR